MSKGQIMLYSSIQDGRRDLYYDVDLADVRLGGLSGLSEYTVKFTVPLSSGLETILLEVGVVSKETRLAKWRLWVNNVAVTREFKPAATIDIDDDSVFSKAIFDLKPIIEPSGEYTITIQYDGSPETLLTHIGLLAIYSSADSLLNMEYYSGAVALSPGESLEVKPQSLPSFKGMDARLVLIVPNKLSNVTIACGNSMSLTGVVGPQEARVKCTSDSITLRYHEAEIPFYPRTLVVSSLLAVSVERSEPRLSVSLVKHDEGKALVRVSNTGSAEPEYAQLIVVSRGQVVDRVRISGLKPQGEQVVAVRLSEAGLNIVRLIWRYRGELYTRELKIRVS